MPPTISAARPARRRNQRLEAITESKDTLCRNVLIYGHCRYENSGCAFNHDQNRNSSSQTAATTPSDLAKRLNVDSPSFTPSSLQTSPSGAPLAPSRKTTFSTTAASVPSFVPRGGSVTPGGASKENEASGGAPGFTLGKFQEFTPQGYELNSSPSANGNAAETPMAYDAFSMAGLGQGLSTAQYNPYLDDPSGMGASSSIFQQQNAFAAPIQPLQYHLYAPLGVTRDGLLPYQRQTHDFFLPESIREEAQRKLEATHQVLANTSLPVVDNYHSLVPLDTSNRENMTSFKYVSWVYKGVSQENGKPYCLRRIKDFRLTNENAIRSVKEWKKVFNASVVTVHSAFTTRKFGDSSIIFVYDYHPRSKTLIQQHFAQPTNRFATRNPIPEDVLWSYITQLANALRAIHGSNLAARCLDPSKIIVTEKNRIRLGACSILDVVDYESRLPIPELQQADMVQFGQVMLSLASNTAPGSVNYNNVNIILQQVSNIYSEALASSIAWLLFPAQAGETKSIDVFISKMAGQVMKNLDSQMQAYDSATADLYREIENGRMFRLMAKLGAINERQEFDGDRQWSENGDRYMLKLFRDYVFHQVDANGQPVVNIGHIVSCLNKLDAGTEERICLTSRDEQSVFIVSYKELKKQIGSAFGDLLKGNPHKARGF
ncbi:PAB-dependent poly(A)-specific ribonuclease subunit PAN3 [Plectosphaerella plurivora]|uniref:PAN2-PAN3 deadenylation complex subunit PAN3 n=1 Tax=Plectosphaerella plurivora TaxID=936078 RepID=A0A9P8VDW4_9PEZI|nr:PAB-dependent poly(A)-specific ribonuclease subunit PAN3 [Plectosphaerella plurivora]